MNNENFPPVASVDLLRSSSSNDVLTDSGSFSTTPSSIEGLRTIKSNTINSQPQDFVVTNGQTYRVSRSPMGISLWQKGKQSISDSTTCSSENSPEHTKIKMLLKALDEANRKIAEQANELMILQHNEIIYQKRINLLEGRCGEDISHFPPLSSQKTLLRSESGGVTDNTSRQRSRIHSALRSEKDLKINTFPSSTSHLQHDNFQNTAEAISVLYSHTTPNLTNTNGNEFGNGKLRSFSEDTNEFITPPVSNRSTPSSTTTDVSTPFVSSTDTTLPSSASEEVLEHSPINADVRKDNATLMDSSLKQKTSRVPSSKSALAARLGMSAKDRRNDSDKKHRGSFNTRKSKPRIETQDNNCSFPQRYQDAYVWEKSNSACTLFIAHDNPQLGKTVFDGITTGMKLMIESKAHDGRCAFILGNIVYSGPVEKVLISREGHLAASTTLPRGSQCIICNELSAFSFDINKDCETRVQGVIAEIHLSPDHLPKSCVIDISTEEKLTSFFRTCNLRVDVILAPHHSHGWYPYWEYASPPSSSAASGRQPGPGARKMAPQFRSKGIGYLRLGDDMSRFGTSFLSCDGFDTFLDEGKGGVEDKSNADIKETKQNGSTRGPDLKDADEKAAVCTIPEILCEEQVEKALHSLESPDLKWCDRVSIFQRTHDFFSKHSNSRSTCDKSFLRLLTKTAHCLADHLRKQKNPLVLKEAVRCSESVGHRLPAVKYTSQTSFVELEETWMALFIQCVHNLRHTNRGVSEASKATLSNLTGTSAVNLKVVGACIRDMVIGPIRSGSSGQIIPTAPNTSRILQWTISVINDYSSRLIVSKFYAEDVGVVAFQRDDKSASSANAAPLSYVYNDTDSNPIISIFSCVVILLSHKEAPVRESAVTICALLISLDVLHCGNVSLLSLDCFDKRGQSSLPHSDSSVNGLPTDLPSLQMSMSSSCQQIVTESLIEDKLQSKVIQRSIEYLNKLYSSKACDSESTSLSAEHGSHVSSRAVIKKSLSTLSSQKGRRQLKLRRSSSSSNENEKKIDNSKTPKRLADTFFEVQLSLKVGLDHNTLRRIALISRDAPVFFASMRSVAKRNDLSLGALLNKVLPFDEDTPSNDQSAVNNSARDLESAELKELRSSAVAIRSLIRVKMADENDFNQAEYVMNQLSSFLNEVDSEAKAKNLSSIDVVNSLKM